MESFVTISGLVIGLTAVAKKAGLSSRFLPTFAILSGVGLSLLVDGLSTASGVAGLVASLSSMGLYSGVSATTKSNTY